MHFPLEPDATSGPTSLITQIIRRVGIENDTDWTAKYFNDEAQAKIEERKKLRSPEFEERVTREWNELFHDIDRALNEDPAGTVAQGLVRRWQKLVGEFTGGNAEIQKGLNAMYAYTSNGRPDERQHQIKPEIQAFIVKAMTASPTT